MNKSKLTKAVAKAMPVIPLVRTKPVEIPEIKPLYAGWCIFNTYTGNPEQPFPTSCLLVLPGRMQSGFQFANWYRHAVLNNTMIIGVTPKDREWYPMPNGVADQADALRGLTPATKAIENVLQDIEKYFGFTSEDIALVGYSAGAVVALETLARTKKRFAAIVSHAGAILDPQQFGDAPNDTPVHLIHSIDDGTFEWNERYVPSKLALLEKGYNASFCEKTHGGHGIQYPDILFSGAFLHDKLPDYDDNYLSVIRNRLHKFYTGK